MAPVRSRRCVPKASRNRVAKVGQHGDVVVCDPPGRQVPRPRARVSTAAAGARAVLRTEKRGHSEDDQQDDEDVAGDVVGDDASGGEQHQHHQVRQQRGCSAPPGSDTATTKPQTRRGRAMLS